MPLPTSRAVHPRFHDHMRDSAIGDRSLVDQGEILGDPTADGQLEGLDWVPGVPELVYEGPMLYQPDRAAERVADVGEETVTRARGVVAIPATAPVPEVGHVVKLTHSHDTAVIGRPLTVVEVTFDSMLVRRLLAVVDDPETTPDEE